MTPITLNPAARRAAAGGMPLCGYFAGRGLDRCSLIQSRISTRIGLPDSTASSLSLMCTSLGMSKVNRCMFDSVFFRLGIQKRLYGFKAISYYALNKFLRRVQNRRGVYSPVRRVA
jgi:hypothetical protein